MDEATKKFVALVIAGCAVTLVCLVLFIRQAVISPDVSPVNPVRATAAQSATGGRGQRGMTLRGYAPADPTILADLEKKVKARQATKDTAQEITINLKPYVNRSLTDPLADQPEEKEHTLEALPKGAHTYGGVPFDVQGIIQLNGNSIQVGPVPWPSEVMGISIGHPFKKLHVLQGAFNIVSPRAHITFAELILHYADGAQEQLELTGGTQTLPVCGSGGSRRTGSAPSTANRAGVDGFQSFPQQKQSQHNAAPLSHVL